VSPSLTRHAPPSTSARHAPVTPVTPIGKVAGQPVTLTVTPVTRPSPSRHRVPLVGHVAPGGRLGGIPW
jgi:hypothetical protein